MKTMHFMLINLYCTLGLTLGPRNAILFAIICTVMTGNTVLMMRSYIKGPRLTSAQRLEISRKKTAELEKDLGYEPLNLHELDEIVLDDRQHRKETP